MLYGTCANALMGILHHSLRRGLARAALRCVPGTTLQLSSDERELSLFAPSLFAPLPSQATGHHASELEAVRILRASAPGPSIPVLLGARHPSIGVLLPSPCCAWRHAACIPGAVSMF